MAVGVPVRKYAFIDALRGLAFLAVLAFHAFCWVPDLDRTTVALASQGYQGVELFFIASALTLFLSMDSRCRAGPQSVSSFYLRRFFRIAPLFYCGALFYYGYDRLVSGGRGPGESSLACILATLTFTHGLSIDWINRLVPGGWSIAAEMSFYLIVPLLYRTIRGPQAAAIAAFLALIGGAIISAVGRQVLLRSLGDGSAPAVNDYFFYWLPAHLSAFFLGIALYFLIRPELGGTGHPEAPRQPNASFLLLLSGYLMVSLAFSSTRMFLHTGLFGVAFVLMAWSLAIRPNRLLVNRFTQSLGKVSFSCYLAHFAVLDQVRRILPQVAGGAWAHLPPLARFVALFSLALLGTWAVASITYRLIEVPGQALGRRLIDRLEPDRLPTTPTACEVAPSLPAMPVGPLETTTALA